tara:strand:+ start:1664 stop:2857 length:1194 start_codon:yes stop_codon:yes gene_type:complete
MNTLVVLFAKKLSGAEKRTLRYLSLCTLSSGRYTLLLNRGIFDCAIGDEEFSDLVCSLRDNQNLVVIPNPPIRFLGRLNAWYTAGLLLHMICNRGAYDLVHSIMIHYPNLVASLFTKHKTLCEVCGPQEVPMLFGKPASRVNNRMLTSWLRFQWLRPWILRHGHGYICVSPSVLRKFEIALDESDLSGLKSNLHCPVVPLYVPNSNIIESSFVDSSKEKLIVYASSFYGRKNPVLFARVLARFLKKHTDWKAAVLGGGELEAEVKEILIDATVSGQVELIGRVATIYPYLVRSKVYVSLITPDNYPSQSVFEAMYCKNALLCTDVGDTGRMVGDENGILTSFEEDDVLRDLERLVDDDLELTAKGKASRARLLREFPSSLYVENIHAIYQKIAKEEK